MLTEDEVIRHMCEHLKAEGYRVISSCGTGERGVDIVAKMDSDGRMLRVEAKGGTSAKGHTKRYGKAFSGGQVLSHVSRAFFTAAALRERHGDGDAGIAVPDDAGHGARVGEIAGACRELGILVFMVGEDGSVRRLGGA